MNDDGGQQLGEGGWTNVVRIGDTVRRPVRPFTATIQRYLEHLHARGFDAAPLPLGYDDAGREILSYVPGDVPVEPLPAEAICPDVLTALARLIRRLHDAAQGWVPPEDIRARVRLIADAYRMNLEQRRMLVDVAIQRGRNASLTAKAAAEADPVFKRWWDEGIKDRMPRAEAWLSENADLIRAAL